jgi:2-hydroxy-6-oxonona-2,4-dienedioate hydrolase
MLQTRRAFARGLGATLLLSSARPKSAAAEPVPEARSPALRDRVVMVDGLPVFTRLSADPPPGAPPLVLVHGLALSGRYMVPTAEVLAERYDILMPDLPGFGDSGKLDRVLDVSGLADWLAAWMEAVGLERAMLLGNSFACQVIIDLAARYPERVERAVLQGPTTPPDERTWLQQYRRWRENAPFSPPAMDAIATGDYIKCGLVRALKTFEFSLRDRPEDKLRDIQAPMLVVRGALDPIAHQYWVEQIADGLPDGRLVMIPDVAHTLVFTAPVELTEASRPFLDESPLFDQENEPPLTSTL